MKLRAFIVLCVICFCANNVADVLDDQPSISVNNGNLVFQSAESRNISIQLKGKSRFLINNIDVLQHLSYSNSRTLIASDVDNDVIASLVFEVAKLKSALNSRNGILVRMGRVEMGVQANATVPNGPTSRNRYNILNRRIGNLELKFANMTITLVRDNCKSYPCKNGGTCFNLFDTFHCQCPDNWEGPMCNVDVNECSRYAGTDLGCQNGATCVNEIGSYACICTDQWKGQNCNRKKVDCSEVPQSEICGHGTCVQASNKLGYSCICEQGWRVSLESKSCTVDVNECSEMHPHCSADPPVVCVNTPGSFLCGACPAGFTGNGYSCYDVNECEDNNGGCSMSPKVKCINRKGTYRCANCPQGYEGDGKTCTPIAIRPNNECADSNICNENAQCVQYPNQTPMCLCRPGYTGNGMGISGCSVVDVDPCAVLKCKNGGSCVVNENSVSCSCPPGFTPPLCDRVNDLCASSPCLNNGQCSLIRTGFFTSYKCKCQPGFSGAKCQTQAQSCGGLRDTINGTIRYPDKPNLAYVHDSRCAWLIQTNITKVLSVTFQKFDIEQSNDCRYDWLQIHDGHSSSSRMIGRFCGTKFPNDGKIITTTNELYLWFRSDNSTARDGFELSWESVDPECGGMMNITSHGTISSPGSPGKYPPNRDCEWILIAPPGKRIQFLFFTLMIEVHETCAFDYVEIHNGLSVESPSLGKFCNTTNPPPLITPGHTATIHFHSDEDSNDVGFQIAYSVIEGVPGCGGIYTSPKGEITSPNDFADGKYQNNLICDYIIQMPRDSRIQIEFKNFSLEARFEGTTGCIYDKVEIFEGTVYDDESLIGRYCGNTKPPIILSQSNTISIKFTTDSSLNAEGFQLEYQLICGGVFTADGGSISSLNYPQPYPGDRTCEYSINAPLGNVIVLNFLDLDIEAASSTVCTFDNLEVFDGFQADNATSLGRFCGNMKPDIFTSTYNHMLIRFTTDSSNSGRGFSANYSFVDVECGGMIKDQRQTIKSPMDTDDEGVYKLNADCRWLVVAPKGYVIQMTFINFDLELDAQCKYDSVRIFNNGSGKGDMAGPFCGKNAPKVITTIDNLATVLFQTDSSTAQEGFTISLAFIDATELCGGNYFSSQGVIRSPGTSEYLPNKNCEWIITVPIGQQIEVTFKYFEVEEGQKNICKFDGLEVRNGGYSIAPLVGTFCGSTIPGPFRSFGNQLYLKFFCDSSLNFKGFEMEWDGTSTGCGGVLTSTKGSITSPNYPSPYAHNAQCNWRISVNEGSTIEIIIADLDLEIESECRNDFVEIFDGFDASATSFGRFCTENHPMHLQTVNNHAMIRLNTDESIAARGFMLKYSFVCNRTIEMDSGVIESPNFPEDYPDNMDCAWTIKVSKGHRINLQFSHFELEYQDDLDNERNCKYDYLEIRNLNESLDKERFCNNAPGIRISTSNTVTIIFHSDDSTTSTGFRLEWFNEGCGGKLNHPEGEITSPNYPNHYNQSISCLWVINVAYGFAIEVTIHDLDVEASNNCFYDSLTLSNDKSFNSTIAMFCATQQSPKIITSQSHQLFVKFDADESHTGKGFNMTYQSVHSDCGGSFSGTYGAISTPNYPKQNYANNKNCEWNIKTDSSHSILLSFLEFDLESSLNCSKDFVEIYDPIVHRQLWKGCGNEMPNPTEFSSVSNELNVRLVTDETITAKGFKANFTSSPGARIITNDTGEIHYEMFKNKKRENCTWIIIAGDPSKKIILTFSQLKREHFAVNDSSSIDVFDGDSVQGNMKATISTTKAPSAIFSNGNALSVKMNSYLESYFEKFTLHYSVLDNACGGKFALNYHGEFSSPHYPDSSPLSSFCIWEITANPGYKLSLTILKIDIPSSPDCNDNYLEIRKNDITGPLIGVYCGNEIPANLGASQSFWIKYQTDSLTTSNGFLAEYKYLDHCDLQGSSGVIESPFYPQYISEASSEVSLYTYRIAVAQGSVIRIEFPFLFMEHYRSCSSHLKVFDGYDKTAGLLRDDFCTDAESFTSSTNIIFIEFQSVSTFRSKFQMTWIEVDRIKNKTKPVDKPCYDIVVSLANETEILNITSPGYPNGYDKGLKCNWTIVSGEPSMHPAIQILKLDLEDVKNCVADYIAISSDREDGSWKRIGNFCTIDHVETVNIFEGTPNIKLEFRSDFVKNRTGFHAIAYLECGGKMTDSEGLISYNASSFRSYHVDRNCMWNITVRVGKTIQFEFLEMDLRNKSNFCDAYVTIRNGFDDASPYLGEGRYCGNTMRTLPPTSSNRAFVMLKVDIPMNSFKLRYSEIQHNCGGQIRLTSSRSSVVISSPNYPNIPPAYIECKWTILAPNGENIKIDFLDDFILKRKANCDQEYVEIRGGLTSSSELIGKFCTSKPSTKVSQSNTLLVKYFTDIPDPSNGFKVNISIGVCGGTQYTPTGYLASPKYPTLGAYPSNSQCDYRIRWSIYRVFTVKIIDIDLPPLNGTVCDRSKDHLTISSVIPDFNGTSEETVVEHAILCGNQTPLLPIMSGCNEISIKFNTFEKTTNLYRGFKLFFDVSENNCGESIAGEAGVITSPGYPSSSLNNKLCQWEITVSKGKRVKIELVDVDFGQNQQIYIYNDFTLEHRLASINNDTEKIFFTSSNQAWIRFEVYTVSQNRGFKLKFSSDDSTICDGNLNNAEGEISLAYDSTALSFTCDYERDLKPIVGAEMDQGTIAFYLRNISVIESAESCSKTFIDVTRRSCDDDECLLSHICSNDSKGLTILSPFPDVSIGVRQKTYGKPINFTMSYKTHKCGGIIQNSGVNFIANLAADASQEKVVDCAWFVKYPVDSSISIVFTKLNLKLPCDQEFVQIYNGPTALFPSLGKFCGTQTPQDPIVSQVNSVFIEYHTDNFKENSKDSILEMKIDSTVFGCGGILTDGNVNFKTPMYGKAYPSNTECIWELRSEPGYHIGLSFTGRFFIEDSTNCTKDYVEAFDYIDENWRSLGRRCGRNIPKPLNSTSTKMKVIFRSDENGNGDGFNATWQQNCGGTFEVDETSRIFSSPGYPKRYQPFLACNYTFVTKGKFINLNFIDFDLQTPDSKCKFDNVTIYRRRSSRLASSRDKLGTFCERLNPGKFRSENDITVTFMSDKYTEGKGFQIEYKLDDCGGVITTPTIITLPIVAVTPLRNVERFSCSWNITAPSDKQIIVRFETFNIYFSSNCYSDFVDVFNGTSIDSKTRLARLCGNLTNTLRPIVITNNEAVIKMSTRQASSTGFSAAIYFQQKCDESIVLSAEKSFYVLDKTSQNFETSMECTIRVIGDPLSVINIKFTNINLSSCNARANSGTCDCNYVEVLNGNGPFSEVIGRYCNHTLPSSSITTSHSAVYIRFVTESASNGFAAQLSMIESPCGRIPRMNFTGNETEPIWITLPANGAEKYPPNLRCVWIADAPRTKKFDIQFYKFELEDSDLCSNDSLTIEDKNMKETITEGLGEETIHRGKQPSSVFAISSGRSHVYCGSGRPHDYLSQSNSIAIRFKSNSNGEFAGFNFSISTLKSCARNFTALQGKIVSAETSDDCRTSIKVPDNYTIALYFIKFAFFERNCSISYLKVYDGDFESGKLVGSFCDYTIPKPIFSSTNQLSLDFHYDSDPKFFARGQYNLMYVASDKGAGCGGSIYNYDGSFTSPMYPSSNRSYYDCSWSVQVPQNLKVGLRFTIFDMGTSALCESDYVEILEANDGGSGEMIQVRKFCGDDRPAPFTSTGNKVFIHYVQTLNFPGTGWVLSFVGLNEGEKLPTRPGIRFF